MRNHNPIDAVPPVLAQLTLDLAECVDSLWAVAMSVFGSGLLPLYTFGRHPDLARCVTSTASALAQPDSSVQIEEDWAPKVTCPIRLGGELTGVLVFGPKNNGSVYTAQDRDLIARTAEHVAFLLSDGRMAAKIGNEIAQWQRTKLELDSAREVQDRCFPYPLPAIKGLDYYGECRRAGELGGDFFDFVAVDRSSLLLSIGDVSGKGVPAAMITAGAQASLRAFGLSHRGRISDLVRDLNRMVWQISPDDFYATLFYARLDGAKRELQYVNAGHDRVMLFRENARRAVILESTGTVLGLSTRAAYGQRTVHLESGDVLVAVTDGITEASNANGNLLEEDLVLEAVRTHPGSSSTDLAGHIMRAVDKFVEGTEPEDDRTVIVVRFPSVAMHAIVRKPVRERAVAFAAA